MTCSSETDRYLNHLKRTNGLIHDWKSMNKYLCENMPGKWSQMHVTKLVQKLPGHERFLKSDGKTECVKTVPEEVDRLLEVLNMDGVKTIIDPFDGTGCISSMLKKNLSKDVKITTNDICPEHGNPHLCDNALDDKLYVDNGPFDCIITSPWFSMLDIALPLSMKHSKQFVALHVPSYYITNAPTPRMEFLKKLSIEKRIFVVSNMTKNNPTRMSCVWLLIFSSKEEAKKRVKNNTHSISFIF